MEFHDRPIALTVSESIENRDEGVFFFFLSFFPFVFSLHICGISTGDGCLDCMAFDSSLLGTCYLWSTSMHSL